MGSSFGGTVKLSGESEYRQAVKQITSNLKELSSELKLTTAQFHNEEKSVYETRQEYNNINAKVKEQREHVKSLKETLANLTKEYGENNEKVKTFKTQLNKAETELANMEKATKADNNELKEMKKGFDNAGSSGIKFGQIIKANVVSSAIIAGVKGLSSAVLDLGKAFVNIGKQAIESYANYEQLLGGVETLFEDLSYDVEKNANKAYKTAGMSANEYMETAMGFAASLSQSLQVTEGNISKLADITDMAILDMSDNSNKMGTSMESLQNAYQGFAKQNYTMLDNLKLGYGGTKTEMERLLKDAQKISGVKYNINNLNDVYNAIHIIQNELGITGTTAKEASSTISGSINSMKSSWQNLIMVLADDNADLEVYVNDFVESIGAVAENIIPRIEIVANSLGKLVLTLAQKLIENLPQILQTGSSIVLNLVQGIRNMIPDIIKSAVEIVKEFVAVVTTNLPEILKTGAELQTEMINGIAETLPELVPVIIDALLTIVNTLLDNIEMIIDAGINLIMALSDGLINALPILIDRAPEIIAKLVMALANNLPKIIGAGINIIISLAGGLIQAIPEIVSKVPEIVGALCNAIGTYFENMKGVGRNLIEGMGQGIMGAKDWLIGKVKELCHNSIDAIKSFFGIHSPSKVMETEVGKYLAEGIGVGFSNEMKDVTGQMQSAIPSKFDIDYSNNNNFNTSNISKLDSLINILNNYLPEIISSNSRALVLDTGALVGGTASSMDLQFRKIQFNAERGN